jgi:transcriptional regulator with XRE-family HTH domain
LSQQEKKEFLRNFSDTLKAIRTRRGWSQEELADALRVSAGAVANWETMANGPTRARLKDIAEKLNVSIDYLAGGAARARTTELAEDAPPYKTRGMREEAERYFREFLDRCNDEADRLGWLLVELRSRFPLNKWESQAHVPSKPGTVSYKRPDRAVEEAARKLLQSAADQVIEHDETDTGAAGKKHSREVEKWPGTEN